MKRSEEEWAGRSRRHLNTASAQRSTAVSAPRSVLTLEHILDENTALSNVLINRELLVVGRDEENHGGVKW